MSYPPGEDLYVLSVCNQYIGGWADILVGDVKVMRIDSTYLNLDQPIGVASGEELCTDSGSFVVHGFLVDATVTPVTTAVHGVSSYTVPAGKNLYIMSLYSATSADLRIDADWFMRLTGGLRGLNQPIMVTEGQVVTAGGAEVAIMGYLR